MELPNYEKSSPFTDEELNLEIKEGKQGKKLEFLSPCNEGLDSTNPQTMRENIDVIQDEQFTSRSSRKSSRSTSATLAALDSSRCDIQLLKTEGDLIPLYFGNNIPFLWIKGKPFFTIGPHWPLSVCLLASIILAVIFISEMIAKGMNEIYYFAEFILGAGLIFFFVLTSLRNPGIATEKDDGRCASQMIICQLCKVMLDNSTFHCFDCRVCIRGFDHHCPWTGKCIGRDNKIWFKCFIAFFFIFFVYSIVLCAVYFM